MKRQLVRIPIASHGLHHHRFSYPYLGTFNFMDVCPVFVQPLRKGEKCKVNAGLFSRLNPQSAPAFITGRYNFKSFFVPYTSVFKPWYAFDSQTEYEYISDNPAIPTAAPNCQMHQLTKAFIQTGSTPHPYVNVISNQSEPYDFDVYTDNDNIARFKCTPTGSKVLKVLNSLGYSPTWDHNDSTSVNLLNILSYIRIFLDYFWPAQYVGNNIYNAILTSIKKETGTYTLSQVQQLILCLGYCVTGFYDNSLLCDAFDTPVNNSSTILNPTISLKDITNDNTNPQVVSTSKPTGASPTSILYDPKNGTPAVYGSNSGSVHSVSGVITQYVLDSLQAINNFVQRSRLAGGRLLDRVFARRGEKLQPALLDMSYYLGQKDVEISVDAVLNNSNTNTGEMAGKGVASTENNPLHFECTAENDGVFMIICSVITDADMPIWNDPYNFRVSAFDFMHSEFDKLGPDTIPTCVAMSTPSGTWNNLHIVGKNFGFLNRYYGDVMERTRLTGDFRLNSRGAQTLKSYHTFRLFDDWSVWPEGVQHSWNFLSGADWQQYQRMFYSADCDNLMMFIRFTGDNYLEKLPLGDSYDWDDDEFNRKVEIVKSGQRV